MDDIVGENSQRGKEVIHTFEYDTFDYKITLHVIIKYYYKIIGGKKEFDYNEKRISRISKIIEKEFRESEEIKRAKSALFAIKYGENSYYFIFKQHKTSQHGNIYVVNQENIIKTMYPSSDSGWYEQYLINSKMNPKIRFKYMKKALNRRRNSVTKKKDE